MSSISCHGFYTRIPFLNKDCIIKALDWLHDDLYPDILVYTSTGSDRTELVKALCEYRQQYFNEFPEVQQRKLEEIDLLDKSDAITTRTMRMEQIKGRIYQLDDKTKKNFGR